LKSVAAMTTAVRRLLPSSRSIVLLAGSLAWLVNAAILWCAASPLGHDEAQYALAAQQMLAGAPSRWNYLSYGMNAIAAPGVIAGGGERALRVVPLVLGVGFVLAAANLARRFASPGTSGWLVAVLAATIAIAKRSTDLLSDMPSTACLLAATAIAVLEVTRPDGPRRRVVWAAPWLAAAFYLRYGSCIPIAIIGAVVLVGGWRGVVRRPGPVIATILVLAALLVPHVAMAIAATGSPLGIVGESSTAIGSHVGSGLVTYMTANPFVYYGLVATPLLIAGLVAIARVRDRRIVMLWVIAVADIIALGVTTVGQSRYIYLGLVLLLVIGIDATRRWIAARPAAIRCALGWASAAALVASWLVVINSLYRTEEVVRAHMAGSLEAITAIRGDARGASCSVLARHSTQLEWYSGCVAVATASRRDIESQRVYVVTEPRGACQPVADGLPGRPHAILDQTVGVGVVRVDP
jgi:hypothetical protein